MSIFIKGIPFPIIVIFVYWCYGGNFERGEGLGFTMSLAILFYIGGVYIAKEVRDYI